MNRIDFIKTLAAIPFISLSDAVKTDKVNTLDIQKQVFDTLYNLIYAHNMNINYAVLEVVSHLIGALYLEEDVANHDLIVDLENISCNTCVDCYCEGNDRCIINKFSGKA